MARHTIVIFHLLFSLFVVACGLGLSSDPSTAVYPLCLTLTLTFAWACWSWWWLTGTLFDPYGMFMTSLFLFNAGQAPLELAGLNERGLLRGRFDDGTLVATLYMVLLGFVFTHLGAVCVAAARRQPLAVNRSASDAQALRGVGWFLLAVSIAPSVIVLWQAGSLALSAGYQSTYQRELPFGVAATPQVLAMFLVPVALMLLAGAEGRRREKGVAVVVVAFHTIVQLFLGYRSAALMPTVAFLWLWHRSESRIKSRWLLGLGLFALVVIIPVFREMRTLMGAERIAPETFINVYQSLDNPLVSSISEMGASMVTVAFTYVLVPATRAFDQGLGYGYAAMTLLPNLFWEVHPTIAHGTANDWLIWTVDPYNATRQSGLGYSCIAEAYLNFGWVGVPLVMGAIGAGVAFLARLTDNGDRARLAMVAAFTAFALKFPRDESAFLIRAVVWYSWLPYAVVQVFANAARSQKVVAADVLHDRLFRRRNAAMGSSTNH